jgi:hypothetical protein
MEEPPQIRELGARLTGRPWQVVILTAPVVAVGAFLDLLANAGTGQHLLESAFALATVLLVFFRFLPGSAWYRSQCSKASEVQGVSRSGWLNEVALIVQALLLVSLAYGVRHIQFFVPLVIIFLAFDVLWLGVNTLLDLRIEKTSIREQDRVGRMFAISIPEFQQTAVKWLVNNALTLLLIVALVYYEISAMALGTSLLLGFSNTAIDLISTRRPCGHYLSYFG